MTSVQANLLELLDFSKADDIDSVRGQLIKLSVILFYKFRIRSKDKTFRLTSAELYLKDHSGVAHDPTTHGDEEQKNRGTWYVHRRAHAMPSRSGIDVTCGNSKYYGGILIRDLDIDDGSGKACTKLIRGYWVESERFKWADEELEYMKQVNGQSIFSGDLKLEEHDFLSNGAAPKIFIGPRVLSKEQREKYPNVASLELRTSIWKTTKFSKQMREIIF